MKEYKIKINGNDYNVTIDEVEGNAAKVEVNGTPYNVEFEKPLSKKPKTISVVNKPAAAPAAGPAPGAFGYGLRFLMVVLIILIIL